MGRRRSRRKTLTSRGHEWCISAHRQRSPDHPDKPIRRPRSSRRPFNRRWIPRISSPEDHRMLVFPFLPTSHPYPRSTDLNWLQNAKEPNADLIAMLLANMAKSDHLKRILTLTRAITHKTLSPSKQAMDQLMDCFVKGAEGRYNEDANYDYLAYLFADLAKVWVDQPSPTPFLLLYHIYMKINCWGRPWGSYW